MKTDSLIQILIFIFLAIILVVLFKGNNTENTQTENTIYPIRIPYFIPTTTYDVNIRQPYNRPYNHHNNPHHSHNHH